MPRPDAVDAVTVGGATIAVDRPAPARWSLDRLHAPFRSHDGSPRLDLSLASRLHDDAQSSAPGFECARNAWKVAETPAGWRLTFNDEAGRLHRVVDVDRSWQRGSVSIASARRAASRPFPLDYPIEQLLFVSLLAHAEGAVVHATGVVRDGFGWVFAGTHGQGKSTLAGLFARESGSTVLNDDRVVVRRMRGQWMVFGTPWAGTVRRVSATCAPLAGVFLIRHGSVTRATALRPADAARCLVPRCFHPYWDRGAVAALLATLGHVAEEVPCHDLPFVPSLSAVSPVLAAASA